MEIAKQEFRAHQSQCKGCRQGSHPCKRGKAMRERWGMLIEEDLRRRNSPEAIRDALRALVERSS